MPCASAAAAQTEAAREMTDPASIAALFETAKRLGPVRCVVGAHGILLNTPAGASDLADVSRILDVNLKSVAYLLDLAGRHLAPPAAIVSCNMLGIRGPLRD